MSVVVSKSSPVVVAGPSSQGTPAAIIGLSSFDKCVPLIPVAVLLVFDQPIDGPVETIKHALSRALVHYHPLAGRLAAGADGELHIACTGEGVPLVGASASCSLDKVFTLPGLLVKDLSARYPAESSCGLSDALVMIQVTEFSCGGFVLGVTWNHAVADGKGMAQFLQAVGELARGLPAPSVIPVRSDGDGSLPCFTPPPPPTTMVDTTENEEMASLDFTVSWDLIDRIKAECGGQCTVFDAVAAVLWRCRTRATMSDSDDGIEAPALLSFVSNVRGLVGASEGYYGNCFILQFVRATSGTVAGCDIKDLVKLIRLAKEKIPDMFKNDIGLPLPRGVDDQEHPKNYNVLSLTSWRNIGFDAADLGRGRPARVMSQQPEKTALSICVLCPPCKGKHGVNVLSFCVRLEHADEFLGELAALENM